MRKNKKRQIVEDCGYMVSGGYDQIISMRRDLLSVAGNHSFVARDVERACDLMDRVIADLEELEGIFY